MSVVITGRGSVSCLGPGVDDFWQGLMTAERRPSRVPVGAPDLPDTPFYALDPATEDAVARAAHRHGGGRTTGMAALACEAALQDAKLDLGNPGPLGGHLDRFGDGNSDGNGDEADGGDGAGEVGLVLGTTLGDIDAAENAEPGTATASSFTVAGRLAASLGLGGPVHTVSTACSAGLYALTWAADVIRAGLADVMVVCGADGHSRVAAAALHRFGLLDPEVCRPFDASRQGMVTGEGAACVVLESERSARRRGARVLARLESQGWSSDAFHPTAPEPDGTQLRRAISAAIAASGGAPGAAVLHRAGIAVNDTVESAAVAHALADRRPFAPTLAVKGVLGHTAGAAGVFAFLAATLMLESGWVPPNAHVERLDPECPLVVPLGGPLPPGEDRVLVVATGFGGNNAAVMVGAA